MSTVTKAQVIDVISYGDEVKEYILKLEDYDTFEPGQFLQLTLDEVTASDNWPESRSFSIASYLNEAQTIRLIIKKKGSYTSQIFQKLVKDSFCYVKYAYGDFLLPMFDENPIHCIAGGTGIAPFLGFVEYMSEEDDINKLNVYYSVSKRNDFVHYETLKKMLPNENVEFYCTKQEVKGAINKRISLDDVLAKVLDIKEEHFYICGGEEFSKYFKEELEKKGATNVYWDEW